MGAERVQVSTLAWLLSKQQNWLIYTRTIELRNAHKFKLHMIHLNVIWLIRRLTALTKDLKRGQWH